MRYLLHLGPFAGWLWHRDGGSFEKIYRRPLNTYKVFITFNPFMGLWQLSIARIDPSTKAEVWLKFDNSVSTHLTVLMEAAPIRCDDDAALRGALHDLNNQNN